MKTKRIFAALLTGAALAGCSSESDFEDTIIVQRYSTPLAASASEPVGTELDGEFTDAVTGFSQSLFRNSVKRGENLVLSPLSVTYALTLTANGASGETLAQFNALNGGIDVVRMNEYLFFLTERMSKTETSTVEVANSVWTDSGSFTLNEDFGSIAKKYYKADASAVNFSDQGTTDIINQWVSDHTDGMIPKAVDEIDPMTAMILINTVLFDGKWEKEYEEYQISDQSFTSYSGKSADISFLHSTEYSYFEVENGVGFSKDYKDGYRFTAILPDEGQDVYEFVSTLDLSDAIEAARNGSEKVICAMPKFEYDVEVNLNDILKGLGLTRAFSASEAELEGLGKSENGSLSISTVLQKAKIKLDEHGTKAAAMTQVSIVATSAGPAHQPKRITLDRPFVYMILDSETNIPLFIGITAELNG